MRFFWKIVLITAIPLGGYWLYKKSTRRTKIEVQSEPTEENKATSPFSPGRDAEAKQVEAGPEEQIIERLTKIDGITSRVAENLVGKGIYTREDLMKFTKEELMKIKGIGPKRAEKILKLK